MAVKVGKDDDTITTNPIGGKKKTERKLGPHAPLSQGFSIDAPGNDTQVLGGFQMPIPFTDNRLIFSGPDTPLSGFLSAHVEKLMRGRGPRRSTSAADELAAQAEEQGMSFADYLKLANEMGMGGTPDYGAMEQYLKDNAASSDARLNALYAQLRGSIDADAPGIAQSYDASSTAIDQNAQNAQATTNAGYQSARDAQSQQLAALGIEDAAAVLASNGGFAAGDQGAANANIETSRLAGTQQATANKATALDYNTNIGNAAGLEGNVQRALVQQQLQQSLAELQMQEQQDSVSAKQNTFQTAMQLKSMDDSKAGGKAAGAQQDFDNQLALARLQLDQAKAGGSEQTLMQNLQNRSEGYAYAQQMAQAFGIDPSDPEAMTAFLNALNNMK